MKRFNLKLVGTLVAAIAMAGALTTAQAQVPTVVTFDNGTEGWTPGGDCGTIVPTGGDPGAYWNIKDVICGDPDQVPILQGYYILTNATNPAFIGDYTAKGPVRVGVDVYVHDFTYYWFNSPVEQYRQLVFEFIDDDIQYVDPDTGYWWPWASVIWQAGYYPVRNTGWKHFEANIPDPSSTTLPAGWVGFGGPQDENYMPQLPPGVTFGDIMSHVTRLQIHAIEPGYYYDFGFTYDLDFDNISITALPKDCDGREATVWVDNNNIVHGGQYDGQVYAGELVGTQGDDVIVGTDGDDSINGQDGNDMICGGAGNDSIIGGKGDDMLFGGPGDDTLIGGSGHDYLDGGPGRDNLNGGGDGDTCVQGEVYAGCGGANGRPRPPRTVTSPTTTVTTTTSGTGSTMLNKK
jgi:hypothetical protein